MSFGIPVRNGLAIGLLSSTMLSSRAGMSAALMLNFLTGSLDPRITFSRGSQATLTDSTGKITYAPNNLLTNSESFEASAWTKANATITANAALAPDGTTTADKLVPNTTSASHAVQQSVTTSGAVVISFYAKPAGYSYAVISSSANNYVYFDVANGVVASTAGTGWSSPAITSVGNGWYRCSAITSVANTRYDILCYNTTQASGNIAPTFAGDGTSGIYIWGAQLEQVTYQTTPSTYNSTTPKNLLGYTQEFDNAAWTKSNATITANAIAAPDGSTTADKLVETTANGGHYVLQSITALAIPYTFSAYVKAAERTFAMIYNAQTNAGQVINLATGALAGNAGLSAPTSSSVTDVGNGWYLLSMTITATAASNNFRIYAMSNATTFNYAGDGTSGIYIWGAQLSNSASLDPYVYNPGAAPTSAAYYGPRFDCDPVTLAAKGLLIEEQRTNLLTYSEQFDNAAWTKTAATITANSAVAPDGTTTADTITEDTTAVSAHRVFTTIAASAAAYTASIYVKAGTRSWCYIRLTDSGAVQRYAYFNVSTGTLGTVETNLTASITPAGNGWYRCSATVNVAATSLPVIFAITDGNNSQVYTGNGTGSLYFWGAQAEAGAFATSYIPTVASQVTRSADVATMVGANFSNWYNPNQGTLFTSASQPTIFASSRTAASINDRVTNRFNIYRQSAGGINGFITPGAGVLASGVLATANVPWKGALAYTATDGYFSANGASVVSGSQTIALGSLFELCIGNASSVSTENFCGHIRNVTYYNYRMPNALLQRITV